MSNGKLLQIEACPGFAKDTSSGAILNIDKSAVQAYKTRRQMMRELNSSKDRVSILEDRLDRIERLLLEVLKK